MNSDERISVRGARVHNLKNIDVDLPRDRLVVITGLSGSGKSSLAFDTIYAEGQRRYVESMSAYARQFLEQMEKPDVDLIDGLSPAISIEQKTTASNPRSTVGTVTEIYDYLRLLFATLGQPHCPRCEQPIASQSVDRILDLARQFPGDERINVLAPVVRGRKGEFKKELLAWRQRGFTRVRVDGELRPLEDDIVLDKRKNHTLDVVVDRLIVKPGMERRLGESIEIALALANDLVIINTWDGGDRLFSRRLACADCGISVPELTPRAFSFNSPHGACGQCQGLGAVYDFDPARVILDPGKSLAQGAVEPWARGDVKLIGDALRRLHEVHGIDPSVPVRKLTKKQRDILLLGSPTAQVVTGKRKKAPADPFGADFEGLLPNLRRRYDEGTWNERETLEPYRALATCPSCDGARLKAESRAVRVKGHTIVELTALPVSEASTVFDGIELGAREELVAGRILKEIRERLHFLNDVGVGYLTLGRSAVTLSGGEGQRIRLATQIGSSLSGVLYVLDEPSIGLHQRDNRRLLQTLERLRDLGNTVLVVEHDEETIRTADYVVDLGPGAGEHGGELLFQGTPAELLAGAPGSVTGDYLRGDKSIVQPRARRAPGKAAIRIKGAREHNLQDLDVTFPLGLFIAITGVSGSGKSTLVNDILYKHLARELYRATDQPGAHDTIDGLQHIDKVIQIDQSPIGRTPRSNPATYIGLFTFMRDLFAMLPESRQRGYKPGRFSFNVKGGRCEGCQGDGVTAIEMHFLPDVYVTCEQCKGRRYNRETLEVRYRGKSIADLLELTVDQALPLLESFPSIANKLRTLQQVGLGYVTLGQSATTLSGGEAQRVKLAKELSRRGTGRTLYILDEPTTGLHFDDVAKLLDVLHQLVEQGNTILVIEHNLDVIRSADHVIDLGPEGGSGGGRVVAQGTPEQVARVKGSHTGAFLAESTPAPTGRGRRSRDVSVVA
ncbi:excinuclease ABC subunit UvrA [Luteitalea sp.]|uniref:excinuclease ABC subunit UvrA n=1 Tax=Luteitalea sp. TaxID=2004800 RepID=UPI0025BB4F8D|nr:excinuclease ABC subunit UvrA [Luteitalea sp.]